MQLLLILLLSLCGNALGRALVNTVTPSIPTSVPKLRDLEPVDAEPRALESRDVLMRGFAIAANQELNLQSGLKLTVRRIGGEVNGVTVPPLSQEIERDLDSAGNGLAGRTPTANGEMAHNGKAVSISVKWETRNHSAIRLMGPEWQNILVATYRTMINRYASTLRVRFDISGQDGIDVEIQMR
ncbi:hypothetical protein GGS26DRAFT_587507 [Hypomontagnella submonticulosa]|nr:hypothetical protein GGS26DRAFT_587507 [Hypomontagnella submonticulosa]